MKRILLTLVAGFAVLSTTAQQTEETQADATLAKYRRSSLYSVLIRHPETQYGKSIDSAFLAIPTPDKFNNHDLPFKSFDAVDAPKKRKGQAKDDFNQVIIDQFIADKDIPRKLIAKWFYRDEDTGVFDMELIRQRGNYDASQLDISLADMSITGRAALADAGEELIGKTFMLVNDITFIDKGQKSAKAGGWMRAIAAVAGAASGTDLSSVGDAAATLVNEIDGFSVNITSYLYRLHWDEEVAAHFYNYCWMDQSCEDPERRIVFDTMSMFKISYVGKTMTSAGNLASKSFAKSKEEQMVKVCTRAIDKSIVQLQRDFDEFKVNVPIYKINGDGTLDVQIGLKEGINSRSEFDVLMAVQDEAGRTSYEKVGRIEPIENLIWDNRFGADEDAAAQAADSSAKKANAAKADSEDAPLGNVALKATTFKIVSGANKIVPGCLVREVTIKRV